MLRHFTMKYLRPLSYGATKVMANVLHDHLRRVQTPVVSRMGGRSTGLVDIGRPHTAAEREACILAIAQALPRLPTPRAPTYGAQRAYSSQRPLLKTQTHVLRPAAVKPSGGLRGSTATKWK